MKNNKVQNIIVTIAFFIIIGATISITSYFNTRKYKKQVIELRDFYEDSLSSLVKERDSLIDAGIEYITIVEKRVDSIDKKLKSDEEFIDNRVVTDADIDSLLTRFDF